MPNGECATGAENKARISSLEVNVERLIAAIEKLVSNSVSKPIAIMLAMLSSVCSGLIVGILVLCIKQ